MSEHYANRVQKDQLFYLLLLMRWLLLMYFFSIHEATCG